MDKNRGLVRCQEPIGHHDAYIHAFGYLKASPSAAVREELYRAFCTADDQGYAIPKVVHEGMIVFGARPAEPPF